MKRKLIPLLLGATLAVASGLASAHSNVSFGLYVGAPAYAYAPAYYAPAVVYYAPPPVYYGPSAYYYEPRYYGRPYWGPRFHHGHHRGWERHHRR